MSHHAPINSTRLWQLKLSLSSVERVKVFLVSFFERRPRVKQWFIKVLTPALPASGSSGREPDISCAQGLTKNRADGWNWSTLRNNAELWPPLDLWTPPPHSFSPSSLSGLVSLPSVSWLLPQHEWAPLFLRSDSHYRHTATSTQKVLVGLLLFFYFESFQP